MEERGEGGVYQVKMACHFFASLRLQRCMRCPKISWRRDLKHRAQHRLRTRGAIESARKIGAKAHQQENHLT